MKALRERLARHLDQELVSGLLHAGLSKSEIEGAASDILDLLGMRWIDESSRPDLIGVHSAPVLAVHKNGERFVRRFFRGGIIESTGWPMEGPTEYADNPVVGWMSLPPAPGGDE